MVGKNYNSTLRFKSHKSHRDILLEFYGLNKYLITEQLKDALLDAVECMDYVIQQTRCNEDCETCKYYEEQLELPYYFCENCQAEGGNHYEPCISER